MPTLTSDIASVVAGAIHDIFVLAVARVEQVLDLVHVDCSEGYLK